MAIIHKWLIKFMEAKAERLAEYGIPKELYFRKEDAEAIKEIPLEIAALIWCSILQAVRRGDFGLSSTTCPFCLWYYCQGCPYGKNHGICEGVEGSDYEKITATVDVKKALPNLWYKKVVCEILGLSVSAEEN